MMNRIFLCVLIMTHTLFSAQKERNFPDTTSISTQHDAVHEPDTA